MEFLLIKKMIKFILNKLGLKIKKIKKTHNLMQMSIPFYNFGQIPIFNQIGTFITSDGTKWPVYDNYRYKVKSCWNSVQSLININYLINNLKLEESNINKFNAFIGKYTISAPKEEIDRFALPLILKYADHFEFEETDNQHNPTPITSNKNLLQLLRNTKNKISLALSEHTNLPLGKALDILDVGCGRGVTTCAFAQLGFKATGIDNDYGGDANNHPYYKMRNRISKILDDEITFRAGDISRCPEVPDHSFDFITSISCLEHIIEIDDALNEMFRILRPGGTMLHSLNPFWCENGGHVLGTLDAPWLHTALSNEDFERYLLEWHPHEVEMAVPWFRQSLNKNITINSLQRSLIKAGFEIVKWQESIGNRNNVSAINQKLLHNIHKHHPDVTISDLLATDIIFVAKKMNNK